MSDKATCDWDFVTRANPEAHRCGRPAKYEVNSPNGYFVCGIHKRSARAIGETDFTWHIHWGDMSDDIMDRLRARCCDLGTDDHGHTDCWLHGLAIAEIKQLRDEIERLRAAVLDLVSSPSLRERQAIADRALGDET